MRIRRRSSPPHHRNYGILRSCLQTGALGLAAFVLAGCATAVAMSGGPPRSPEADLPASEPPLVDDPFLTLTPSEIPPTPTPMATQMATVTALVPGATPTAIRRTTTPRASPIASATLRATRAPTTSPTSSASDARPTTDPFLLRKPPAEIDLSKTHLWFSRPVLGNNGPATPYRYGMTYDGQLAPHHAVDLANDAGTPVVAVGAGTVFFAGQDQETVFGPHADFYGQLVVVQMEQKWEGRTIYTLYGHLESVAVTAGQTVNSGDVVGYVGSSGVALAPHLHFELRQDDPRSYWSVRNPELWYQPAPGQRGVLAGRVIDADGRFIPGARVNVSCQDGAPRVVDTYWDQGTPPDDVLVENFAISDLPAGVCHISAELFGETVEETVTIQPRDVTMVVLQASG